LPIFDERFIFHNFNTQRRVEFYNEMLSQYGARKHNYRPRQAQDAYFEFAKIKIVNLLELPNLERRMQGWTAGEIEIL
jgi:hypothetical protein